MVLRIVTWNVNGIRALPNDLRTTLDSLDADIICFQETKITRDQLDPLVALVDGYHAFYSFSRKRSGYSGVAVFCRQPVCPVAASDGLSNLNADAPDAVGHLGAPGDLSAARVAELDSEGRALVLQFRTRCCGGAEHLLSLLCVYCPRGGAASPDRLEFKMDFHALLQLRAEGLAQAGHVVIAGDLNISHRLIDHCDPDEPRSSYSGALHEEFLELPARRWINRLLGEAQRDPDIEQRDREGGGGGAFADTFRVRHPDRAGAYTCWCSKTGARQTNFGNRIDYVLSDLALTEALLDCDIRPEVHGSDHCPVAAAFDVEPLPARCPSLATRFLPEFQGRQRRISDFFAPTGVGGKRSSAQAGLEAPAEGPTRKAGPAEGPKQKAGPAEGPTRKERPPPPGKGLSAEWSRLLGGIGKPPLCRGHAEPCVLRTVRKESANKGRQFWVCAHPEGPASNPNSRCDTFVWIGAKKK